VLSETKKPASEYTQAILNAQNNYWTMNLSSSFVLDDKTVLNLNYFYYQADDYQDNSTAGLPLGADSREHGVTATLTRQINPRLRFNLKYGYYNYKDAAGAGNSNFEAQLLFASVQYRF
jgi:outer membrane protein assembly factor BamA